MKKQHIITIVLSILTVLTASAQTNLNFENWSGNELNGWTTSNEITQAAGGNQTVFQETSKPGEGSSSVKMVTGNCPDCPNYEIPGFLSLPGISIPLPNPLGGGIQLGSFTEPGISYTQRPISVDFRYKANPMGSDAGGLHVTLTRFNTTTEDDDIIGEGYFEANATVSDWTNMNIPIVYYSDLQPDRMDIYATSSIGSVPDFSALGLPALPLPTPVAGSEFYVDAIVMNLPSCDGFIVSVTGTKETSIGESDGTAIAIPSGGTLPYTYSWSTGDIGESISGAFPGLYTVIVTDGNQCQKVGSYYVAPISCNLSVSITGTNSSTNSIFTGSGSASISISGGNPPYETTWNTGASSESISNLSIGTYAVFVVEKNNPLCAIWSYYTVYGPDGGPNATVDNPSENSSIEIYPNPSSGMFSVKSETQISSIEIMNLFGKTIYSAQINSNKADIDLRNEAKGIYFYKITSGNVILKTGKIITE